MKIHNHYKNYKNRKTERFQVSYNFKDKNERNGLGRMWITSTGKHKKSEIEEYIKNEFGFLNVVLLNKF